MAEDNSPASGDWATYQPGYHPYTPGENPVALGEPPPPAQGLLGRWQLPRFNSQFEYPQGLLAQIAQSQQPMQHAPPSAFPRFGFGQQQAPPLPQRMGQPGMNPGLPGLLGQFAQMLAKARGGG